MAVTAVKIGRRMQQEDGLACAINLVEDIATATY
jgi:hypothetical protein